MITVFSRDLSYHQRFLVGLESALLRFTAMHPLVVSISGGATWNSTCVAAQEIIAKKPKVIITIGLLCSQVMRYVMSQEKYKCLLFFGGVDRPDFLDNGLMDKSLPLTGVSLGVPVYVASAHVVRLLKPTTKHVLIPFSVIDNGYTEFANGAALTKRYFQQYGIATTIIPLYAAPAPLEILKTFMVDADAILLFEGAGTLFDIKGLVDLCKSNKISLFAGDRYWIEAGACGGFVADPALAGEYLAYFVDQAVNKDKPIESLPIVFLGCNGRKVMVNEKVASEQGVEADDVLLYLLENSTVNGAISLGEYGGIIGQIIPPKERFDL